MNPTGELPDNGEGMIAAHDPVTGKIFFHDIGYLYAYNPDNNSFQRASGYAATSYIQQGTLDPKRRLFVILSRGNLYTIPLDGGTSSKKTTVSASGGGSIQGAYYPGVVYDPVRDKIVAWAGGNTVYALDLDAKKWTPHTYAGGPGEQNGSGTFGRWNYSPQLDAFVLVNGVSQNAYVFRFPGSKPWPLANEKNTASVKQVFQISPNPSIGLTRITLKNKPQGVLGLSIYNGSGKQVKTFSFASGKQTVVLNSSRLPAGVYLLKSVGQKTALTKKLFITH